MYYQALPCIFLLTVAAGCGSSPTTVPPQTQAVNATRSAAPTAHAPLTADVSYVLVDISRSLDSTTAKATADHASDLVRTCRVGTSLLFFVIDNNAYGEPFFTFVRTSMPDKPKEAQIWKGVPASQGKKLHDLITAKYATQVTGSCIVNGLTTMVNYAKGQAPENRNRLIILSDMLQCCAGSSCGQTPGGMAQLLKQIKQFNLHAVPLKQFVPEGAVTAVVSNSNSAQVQSVYNDPARSFDRFWEAVAQELGYTAKWNITSALPK